MSRATGIPVSARFESSKMTSFHIHTADGDESFAAHQAWPLSRKLQNGFLLRDELCGGGPTLLKKHDNSSAIN